MDELKKDIQDMKQDIGEIKVDLRHHIKRSDKHEKWLMSLIILLSGSLGAGLLQIAPIIKGLF